MVVRQALSELKPFVDESTRRRVSVLAFVAVVAGMLEAGALLLTIAVAVGIATDADDQISLPILSADTSPGLVLAVAAVSAVLVLGLHGLTAHLSASISSRMLHGIRQTTVAHFTNAGWPTQALQREGALQETSTTLAIRTSHLVDYLTTGSIHLVNLAIFLGTSLVVDWRASGAVLVLGFVLVACLRPVSRATRERSTLLVAANSAFSEDVSRLASTSMELRVFGVQQVAARELGDASETVRQRQLRARSSLLFGVGLYKDLAVLLLIACIAGLLIAGGGEIDGLTVVVALMVRSLSFAQGANGSYQALNEGIANAIALNERLSVLEAGAANHGDQPIKHLARFEFSAVGYRYDDRTDALSDVTLELQEGEALGVVGPSGGGKSTFVQVLLRLRPPTSGLVRVDGYDYKTYDEADWSQRIALVPQEPTLIEGSIWNNIRYFRDIDRDAILAAATDANVADEILALPRGFDTELGPRGSGLSGGQKQRVAIARALVGRPELLVMDEPSSALDVHSENLLQTTLERLKGSITMVIVAHRMKTVESCDRLLVLEDGRIAQLGAADELLRSDGFYRRVVEALR